MLGMVRTACDYFGSWAFRPQETDHDWFCRVSDASHKLDDPQKARAFFEREIDKRGGGAWVAYDRYAHIILERVVTADPSQLGDAYESLKKRFPSKALSLEGWAYGAAAKSLGVNFEDGRRIIDEVLEANRNSYSLTAESGHHPVDKLVVRNKPKDVLRWMRETRSLENLKYVGQRLEHYFDLTFVSAESSRIKTIDLELKKYVPALIGMLVTPDWMPSVAGGDANAWDAAVVAGKVSDGALVLGPRLPSGTLSLAKVGPYTTSISNGYASFSSNYAAESFGRNHPADKESCVAFIGAAQRAAERPEVQKTSFMQALQKRMPDNHPLRKITFAGPV